MKKYIINYNGYNASDVARRKWSRHFAMDKYDTSHDAATDIFNSFYDSIEEFGYPEAGIDFPAGIEDDDASNDAMSKMLEDVLKEIETSGRYENDGNVFRIEEVEVGELMVGIVAMDGLSLQNTEPICGFLEKEEDLYTEEDAEEVLDRVVRDFDGFSDKAIESKPWGWDVTTSDDDGNKSTMHVAWKAR